MNPFTAPSAALRYAASRPSGHARVLGLLPNVLGSELPVIRALDVGCGTGRSTVALLAYAHEIVGVDPSSAMLAQAPLHARVDYRKGCAEELPFRRGEFDLVTVSSAYHWFDHDRFLAEAARVLRPGGWLVLYNTGSSGRSAWRSDFERWRREVLHGRYPKVARNDEPLTAVRAARFGFEDVAHETTSYVQRHTLEGYVENLMTHSNVIRVVDSGQQSVDDARTWLRTELASFFPGGEAEWIHQARLHVLRRGLAS